MIMVASSGRLGPVSVSAVRMVLVVPCYRRVAVFAPRSVGSLVLVVAVASALVTVPERVAKFGGQYSGWFQNALKRLACN